MTRRAHTVLPNALCCTPRDLKGLAIRVRLQRCLPCRFKVSVNVAEGTHASDLAITKQLNDKERCAAALENPHLVATIDDCITPFCDR